MSILGRLIRKNSGRISERTDSGETEIAQAAAGMEGYADPDGNRPEQEEEYELVEIEIAPARIICPDCGGITLEGLEFCDKCGGELQ